MNASNFHRPISLIFLSRMPTFALGDAMLIWKEWLAIYIVKRPISDFANEKQFFNTAENLPLDIRVFST